MTKEEIGELIAALPQGLDADEFIFKLVNWAVEREREACAKVCLEGTDMPVQKDVLKIIKAERKRIAKAIRARGER